MPRTVVLLVLLMVGTAAAQPVTYTLQGDVPVGKRPTLELRAKQRVTDVKLALSRDDGKTFEATHRTLAKGQTVKLPIGDGASGTATYTGTLSLTVEGAGRWSGELTVKTTVRAAMNLTYDADHLDLDRRTLQFKLSRPAASAQIRAFGEDGAELGTGAATFQKATPAAWLAITWTQPPNTRVMKLALRVVAVDGLATNVELVPWSVTIAHEDVTFPTNSAVLPSREHAKLDASLPKIADVAGRAGGFMKLKLYVAGHTDTVGDAGKNLTLSRARAEAIARYLRTHGVTMPVAYAGFGESVPKVKTKDNKDEPANRRADYVIGPADGAPPFKGAYQKTGTGWSQLP